MKVTVPVSDVCTEGKLHFSERLTVYYGCLNTFYFHNRKLDEVIEELKNIQKKYKNKYDSLELRKEHNCGCWGDCSCDPSIVLYGTRDENEIEKKVRLHNSEIDNRNQEKIDRQQYEALKRRFEKG